MPKRGYPGRHEVRFNLSLLTEIPLCFPVLDRQTPLFKYWPELPFEVGYYSFYNYMIYSELLILRFKNERTLQNYVFHINSLSKKNKIFIIRFHFYY